MSRTNVLLVIAAAFVLPAASSRAQDAESSSHDELRAFRERLVTAVLEDDIPTQMELAHPDIVTMWQDGRIATGHDDLREFLETLGKGADRGFRGYAQEPTPLALTSVYDDRFAFAHGTSVAQYDLYGMEFDLNNYWTATLLKDDGQWRLVGYHVSGNIADNPLLNAAKNSLYLSAIIAAVVAGLVGILLGFIFGRRSGRGRTPDAVAASA